MTGSILRGVSVSESGVGTMRKLLALVEASSAIEALEKLGIVREVTARQRNRQFVYEGYLPVLDGQGIEPNRVESRA